MTEKNAPFEIAGHHVAPGERLQFDLPAANLYTHTPLNISVEVVHGRQPGPVLLVCAAIHGDELNGVEIIRRLRTLRSLKRLHGTLVLVPVVNMFGFVHQSRYLPDSSRAARTWGRLSRWIAAVCRSMTWVHRETIWSKKMCAMREAREPRGEPGKQRFRSRRSGR